MTNPSPAAARATTPANEKLDTSQAAEYLGVKPHTLEIWRSSGRHKIPHIRVGKLIRYRRSALDAWLEERTVDAEPASAE